jgi:hypothetical protein
MNDLMYAGIIIIGLLVLVAVIFWVLDFWDRYFKRGD